MELIITEKPSSAKKIAEAIADGKPNTKTKHKVKYYEFTADGKLVTVVSAVGHLFTVAEKDKKGWTYPVFDVEWVPSADQDKSAAYTRKYLNLIKSLAKKADKVTVATDFDIEGEVIGYTILRYACEREDGQRMKFSTVTQADLRKAYQNKMDTIAWGQAKAGVTRHELDWFYGINLSRALTLSVKAAGGFKLLSSGRVQTPALKILADREKEIQAFEPDPYWELELHTPVIVAQHVDDRFWEKSKAETARDDVTDSATVSSVDTRDFTQAPPNPFDLTTLQTEAYRSFGMSPKETLSHAQDLYAAGFISYPRTSSQKLPKEIGYEQVLKDLKRQQYYKDLAEDLLSRGTLKPNEGKKTDPAHPAIYPTGVAPTKMKERTMKVYDLVVRRFLATFAEPAKRQTVTVELDSGGQAFKAKGTRTTEPGWHRFYGDHVKLKEEELPKLSEGESLDVEKCDLLEKETKPPSRYTPSSIIKELEKHGLGTKATRADIVENLFNRGYVHEKSIQVSEIGLRTIATLEKYVPQIIDEKLTQEIEDELEKIRAGDLKPEEVLDHARTHLTKILEHFKKHEKEIGEELLAAERETRDARTVLGTCPGCGEGDLQIRKGKYGMFVGCTAYPDCKQTFNLPKGGFAKPAGSQCEACEYPQVIIKRKRSRPRTVCINPDCPRKDLSEAGKKRKEEVAGGEVACPECEKPLSVRSSAYGEFIGCTGYPKCRHTEQLETIEDADKPEE